MSSATLYPLIGLNVSVAILSIGLAVKAAPTDRLVFVVYPPWLTRSDIAHRIRGAGGHEIATNIAPFVAEAVVDDRSIFERIARSGAALLVAARPTALCSNGLTRRMR